MPMTPRIAGNVHNNGRFKRHRRTMGNGCNCKTAGGYTQTIVIPLRSGSCQGGEELK